MRTLKESTILAFFLLFSVLAAEAQVVTENNPGKPSRFEFDFNLGLGVGGSAPIPIPNTISEMSWSPELCFTFGYNERFAVTRNFGVKLGIQLQHVGMDATAKVYQIHTQAIVEDAQVEGIFSGYNETKLRVTYLRIPLLLSLKTNSDKWIFSAGAHASFKLTGTFEGSVSDGYIRLGDATGERVEIDGKSLYPDTFSDELAGFVWGPEILIERCFNRNVSVFADVNASLNSVLKPDFKGLDFQMHNFYVFLGTSIKL